VIFLEITTVSVNKQLVFEQKLVEFSEVAVGVGETLDLLITNQSYQPAEITMDLLPLFCGFSIQNTLNTIPPQTTKSILILFQPHEE